MSTTRVCSLSSVAHALTATNSARYSSKRASVKNFARSRGFVKEVGTTSARLAKPIKGKIEIKSCNDR